MCTYTLFFFLLDPLYKVPQVSKASAQSACCGNGASPRGRTQSHSLMDTVSPPCEHGRDALSPRDL